MTGIEFSFCIYQRKKLLMKLDCMKRMVKTHVLKKTECNPDSWKMKLVKRPGLRNNSPLVPIAASIKCYKKKCLQNITVTHLTNLRKSYQTLTYDEQDV